MIAEKHIAKFEEIKVGNNYFNPEENELKRLKYYFDNKVDPFQTNYEELHALLSSTFQHARRRENFFTNVDRHPDFFLRCVYSGTVLSNADGEMLAKANEEHSFPQSFQRGAKAGTGRDMHAIFASDTSANGCRGNTPFGNKGKKTAEDPCGETFLFEGRKYFQPKINRGALARASLYILVCYKGCANRKYLPIESLEWMVEAAQEEVSLWELHRNQELFKLQGNRNPFIDYPELAKSINFEKGWQN